MGRDQIRKDIDSVFTSASWPDNPAGRVSPSRDVFIDGTSCHAEVKETMQEVSSNNEFTARFVCLKAWYVRASWRVKFGFIVDIISMLCDEMCGKLMRYVGLSRFKDFNYLKSQDIPGLRRDVPLRDTNRCLNLSILDDMQQLDKAWIVTLKESQQLNLLNVLVNMGGCALKRKIYEVLLRRMDRSRRVTAILDLISPSAPSEEGGSSVEDDVSVGVESVVSQRDKSEKVSLDLEWMECFQEIRDYYFKRVQEMEEDDEEQKRHRQSLFFKDPFILFKDDQLQKLQNEISPPVDPKESAEKVEFEYIQFLPEPINMMIFSYLDKETLKVARQVSPYWAFIADQVEKERSARAKLNAFLARLSSNPGEKKTKPDKKSKKKAPPPPPPPVEVVFVPPELDPKGKEKVVLLLKLFKPPTCKSFFSKSPISRCLRDEFFTFRVMCCDSVGQKLAVSTVRCSVDFYSLKTGELMPETVLCTSHMDFITCMCFLPKGTHLVTGSADTTVRYLKLSKKSSELRILEHDKDVTAICCSSKYVVSGSSDACVKVFNLSKEECECVFENSVEVTALGIDQDSTAVYVGFKSDVIKVLKLPEGLLLLEINNTHVDQVSVLHLVSPILLSGGSDGVVRAWDISSNNIQYCLSALGQISKDKAYSPVTALCMEENYVLSGDSKGYVRVWNLVTGKLVKEIQVCGLSQAVVGIHVVRKEDTVEVFACTLSVLKVFTFERKQAHKHGLYGPAYRTCCTVYADPEEAKEKPFGILHKEYEEKKLEKRGCVEQKLKESLAPPMLSASVLIAAIKKRPDVFIDPARNLVVYGRDSVVNT